MTTPDVLTTDEVATELRCTPRTVTNLCNSGAIRAFRIGSQWRITRAALDAFKSGEKAAS